MNKKKIESEISVLMSLVIGFVLTMTGLLSSGSFSLPAFISSYLIGFLVSSIISRIIPLQKISNDVRAKLKLEAGSLAARLVETLVFDLLLTPLMTFVMVSIAYLQASSHGARLNYGQMLGRAEVLSLIVAYFAIFLFSPLIIKAVLKRNGINDQPK